MKILKRISNTTPRSNFRKKVQPPVLTINAKLRIDLDDPTVSSEDASDLGSSFSRLSKGNRHIRLCESKNQVYSSESLEGLNRADIWYDRDEIQQFREDAEDEGLLLTSREQGSHDPSWSMNLVRTYQSFCRVESAHDMDRIFAAMANPEPVDPRLVGLEALAIPQLTSARGQRRSQLLVQIGRIQACTDMSRSERNRRIRKLSHEASRPSRLFALHLAQLVHA